MTPHYHICQYRSHPGGRCTLPYEDRWQNQGHPACHFELLSGDYLNITAWCPFSRRSWSRQELFHGPCHVLLAYLETWHWEAYCPVSLLCWKKETTKTEHEKNIAQCLSCAETKETTKTAPILEYPLPAGPFDVIGVDLLQLPCSHLGSPYVLVCVDPLSRFPVLAPLPSTSATTVTLVSHLICPYTTPRVLLSGNWTECT